MGMNERSAHRTSRLVAAAAAAAALLGGACTSARPTATPPTTVLDRLRLASSLEAFDRCDDLLGYLHREGAKAVGPYGFNGNGGPIAYATGAVSAPMMAEDKAAAPAPRAADAAGAASSVAPEHSTTNVQEEGVDEPDVVKTDGRRLVTVASGQLQVLDLGGSTPRVAGRLPLPEQSGETQLLLTGDRVLVLRPQYGDVEPMPGVARSMPAPGGVASFAPMRTGSTRTDVTVVDIADEGNPTVVADLVVDGSLVAARMVDGTARLVVRAAPPSLPFVFPSGSQESIDAATAANQRVVADSTLDDWLPTYTYDEPGHAEAHAKARLVDCGDVRRPTVFSGVGTLSVFTVDAADPRPGPAASVLGAGDTVYASAADLYVTSTEWKTDGPPASTQIHAFDISDKVRTRYLASGSVPGTLLSSYALSEDKGVLRVATSAVDQAQGSSVTVLRRDGDVLAPIGSIDGLGKDERLYGVRFLGDRGYVVTFRQMDPLHVIDLADPTHPVLAGALEIPGYSAYLHPVGDHRLLGVGEAGTEQGRPLGAQVSLFDVSDPAHPTRLANTVLGAGHSEVEFDPHAFLYWAKTGLALVPLQQDMVGVTVDGDALRPAGTVRHPDGSPARRSIVVGDELLTVSGTGVAAGDLTTLAPRSWTAY
jgi:uncharacterized secreted protein with C-terminal beta-propeller domain